MTEKQKVLLDIDGTLTKPETLAEIVNEYFDRDYPVAPITDYRWINKVLTKEELRDFWKNNYFKFCRESVIADGVAEMYKNYIMDHPENEVYIVTARPAYLRKVTEEWLFKNGIEYNELHMAGRKSKLTFIDDLELTRIIDDSNELMTELEEAGYLNKVEVICVDQSYNQHSLCHKRISQVDGSLIKNEEE